MKDFKNSTTEGTKDHRGNATEEMPQRRCFDFSVPLSSVSSVVML